MNEVNFFDYDGTIKYSYTSDQVLHLTELPPLPDHSEDKIPLTAQDWRWTLEEIKAHVLDHARCGIGVNYVPTDGKTYLILMITDNNRTSVPLFISQTVSNGVEIDWGDGSEIETISDTGNVNTSHTYATMGTYDISLNVTSGRLGFGDGTTYNCILGATTEYGRVYCNMLYDVRVGNGVTTLASYSFRSCFSLKSFTMPNTITNISSSAFRYAYSLSYINLPRGVTRINNSTFLNCYALNIVTAPSTLQNISDNAFMNDNSFAKISLPSTWTTIPTNCFGNCYGLISLHISDTVTSIQAGAFQNCYGMYDYHFKSTTPPNLVSTTAFLGIAPDCTIYAPMDSVETYKTATNWITYASYIQGE